MRWVSLILTLFLSEIAYGQLFSVTGSVVDSTGGVLVNASVVVVTQADSSLIGFTTSHRKGQFRIGQLKPDSYILKVSFLGYKTLELDFSIVDKDVDFKILQLSGQTEELEEFTVLAERLPFMIRGDTVEYNALAFVVRPLDMVEDLLRRLPGIDVDQYGMITAQGETVENVLVEGREFFGKNTTVATKNLPADAIDKVQVYNRPSDLAELTGVPDGQEEKTINLELTQEATRGFLGQVTGGLGSEQEESRRYFSQGTLFRFSPQTQFALIGSGENINQPGFNVRKLEGLLGAGSSAAWERGEHGYSESIGAGLNIMYKATDHTTANMNYIVGDVGNRNVDIVSRRELVDTFQTAIRDGSNQKSHDDLLHEIGLKLEVNLGEGHDVTFRGNLEKSTSSVIKIGMQQLTNPSAMLRSSANSLSDRSSDQLRGNLGIIWRKRISDRGQSLIFETSASAQDRSDSDNLSVDRLQYMSERVLSQESLHQLQEQMNTSFRHSQRLQLLYPLHSGRRLTTYLQHTAQRRDNEKLFFDLTSTLPQGISSLNDGLSENHTNLSSGISYQWDGEDPSWFVSIDLKAQHYIRKGNTILAPHYTIKRKSTHILPFVLAKRELGRIGTLNFVYRTRTFEPTTRQLQPFVDNSNSLRIYRGNPALTPEYHHDLNLKYSLYQSYSGLNLSVDTGLSYVYNSIVRVRTIDTQLRQHISEINGKGIWSGDTGLRIGRFISSISMDWTIRGRMNLDRRIESINGSENTARIWRNSLGLDLNYYRGDLLEVTTSGRFFWDQVKYSLNEELNQNYITGRFTTGISGYLRKSWKMEVSFQYEIVDQGTFCNSQNVGVLNVSMSRFMLGGRGNIRLEINDMLNQNQRVLRTNGATYTQQIRTESLGRYLMLKFTYKPKLM